MQADRKVGRFSESIAGGLAYTLIAAIIFLFLEPYRSNRFVRFHSIQCLLFCAAILAAGTLLKLIALVILLIPVVGALLMFVVTVVVGLAAFLAWLVLVVKAFQGERFELPILGDFADRYTTSPANPGP
jgi:uncharacterized membrane protein